MGKMGHELKNETSFSLTYRVKVSIYGLMILSWKFCNVLGLNLFLVVLITISIYCILFLKVYFMYGRAILVSHSQKGLVFHYLQLFKRFGTIFPNAQRKCLGEVGIVWTNIF